jgi:hypothetical protein
MNLQFRYIPARAAIQRIGVKLHIGRNSAITAQTIKVGMNTGKPRIPATKRAIAPAGISSGCPIIYFLKPLRIPARAEPIPRALPR